MIRFRLLPSDTNLVSPDTGSRHRYRPVEGGLRTVILLTDMYRLYQAVRVGNANLG